MEYSREKLVEIWRRVLPNDPPPEVFDTLSFEPGGTPQDEYALFDRADDAAERCGDARADIGRDPFGDDTERRGEACGEASDDDAEACGGLRLAVERELELTALYHALARWVLAHPAAARCDTRRGSRGVSRELMRLANEQFAAAKTVAGAHLLASGEYHFPAPGRCEVASLRDGLRRAWSLECGLVAEYAQLEQSGGSDGVPGALRRMHSERSLELGGLLSGVFE